MTASRNVDRFVAILAVLIVPAVLVAAWLRDYQPGGHGDDGHGESAATSAHDEPMGGHGMPSPGTGSAPGQVNRPAGNTHADPMGGHAMPSPDSGGAPAHAEGSPGSAHADPAPASTDASVRPDRSPPQDAAPGPSRAGSAKPHHHH